MKLILTILTFIIGAVVGFLYYKFIGCRSGSCPITSNPWTSTIFGALIGYLLLSTIIDKYYKNSDSGQKIEQTHETETDNEKR
jgi:uncharacterized membrane protein YeaQ/YmgE (transglycosylase-associated protein family)